MNKGVLREWSAMMMQRRQMGGQNGGFPATNTSVWNVNGKDVFQKVTEHLKDIGIPLAGAILDFTCPKTGKNYMYFPVKKL